MGDGSNVSDHLASVRAQGGFGEAAASADWPVLEEELQYLWLHWKKMHRRRGSGMGPCAISYRDIEAYCRLSRVQFSPWETDAIVAIDDAFMLSLAGTEEGASDG